MSHDAWWWLTLGLGLVVAVVAVVLLEALLRQVHRVERGADAVWTAGKEVAANTSNTWLFPALSARLDMLVEEAGRHATLLAPPRGRRPTLRDGGS